MTVGFNVNQYTSFASVHNAIRHMARYMHN